jgi:tRNA dimethylallyltransferase
MQKYNLLTVLGPTASGKTALATNLANVLNGEIISADSRQVYRKMDIGTGKDYEDYFIDGKQIPFHLIDIVDAGYKYNVYEYQGDFHSVFEEISGRGKLPVLCGGTGMYIEAAIKAYKLIKVPVNEKLRNELKNKSLEELTQILLSMKKLHNTSDIDTIKRAIRGIEIETYYQKYPETEMSYPEINTLLIGVKFDRNSRRRRISERLKNRLENGMVEEVENLLNSGLNPEDLIYYGLE